MTSRISALLMAGALSATAAGGYFTSQAIDAQAQGDPIKTVTVDVGKGEKGDPGPAGPAGPAGPKGEKGDAGLQCISGYVPGILIINHPGGQTKTYTCLEDN